MKLDVTSCLSGSPCSVAPQWSAAHTVATSLPQERHCSGKLWINLLGGEFTRSKRRRWEEEGLLHIPLSLSSPPHPPLTSHPQPSTPQPSTLNPMLSCVSAAPACLHSSQLISVCLIPCGGCKDTPHKHCSHPPPTSP